MDSQYSPEQVRSVLEYLGIDIVSETETNYLCLCVIHSNRNTPSFSMDKNSGLFMCFSAMCDAKGTLVKLVQSQARVDYYAALRIIGRFASAQKPLSLQIEELSKKYEFPKFEDSTVDRMAHDLWDSPALEYMNGRGLENPTLATFKVGYSQGQQMVTIPMHDTNGNCVGVIGRTIAEKRYKNSKDLPTSRLLFNVHRAKKVGETVIIVESAMDVLKIHQAGFKNVIATNGGFFTEHHRSIIDRYFNELIIMTDAENPDEHRDLNCKKCSNTCLGHSPGRQLGEKIAKSMQHKKIRWAAFDYLNIFPHNAKDPGEMQDWEIKQAIENAVNWPEYEFWKKEKPELARI